MHDEGRQIRGARIVVDVARSSCTRSLRLLHSSGLVRRADRSKPASGYASARFSGRLSSVYRHDDADETILTIKKRVDEVNVLFIATDRHGKFVRNLNQTDFSIFDDHKPVESILNFRRETDLPIELGLLVDVSGSVQGRFAFEKEAATGFLQHMIRPGL